MHRIRITFSKFGKARWIGNLDLHRTWARILRRVGVPIAYSQGFNPQPKIQLASALPLGIISKCEILDVWVLDAIVIDTLMKELKSDLPIGIKVLKIEEADLKEKSLQSRLRAAEYMIELKEHIDVSLLQDMIANFLSLEAIVLKRRGKDYDMRPLVEFMDVIDEECMPERIFMRLSACPGATGRPGEVLEHMGIIAKNINRTGLLFVDNDD